MSRPRTPRRRTRIGVAWRRYVATYGWRAYALPCLIVITAVALLRPGHTPGHSSGHSEPAAKSGGFPRSVGAPAPAPAPGAGSPSSAQYLWQQRDVGTDCSAAEPQVGTVLVSISLQHAWVCDGQHELYDTPVTTGETDNGNQTPLGSWTVQDKQRDRYLVGPGYRDYVHYWIPYNGDFGLHDAGWQTMPFGSPDYRTRGSHGCVHMPISIMERVFAWAVPGQTVVTIES